MHLPTAKQPPYRRIPYSKSDIPGTTHRQRSSSTANYPARLKPLHEKDSNMEKILAKNRHQKRPGRSASVSLGNLFLMQMQGTVEWRGGQRIKRISVTLMKHDEKKKSPEPPEGAATENDTFIEVEDDSETAENTTRDMRDSSEGEDEFTENVIDESWVNKVPSTLSASTASTASTASSSSTSATSSNWSAGVTDVLHQQQQSINTPRRHLLALDLDETLVHCSVEPIDDPDITFRLEWGGTVYTVYAKKRPHLDRFLEEMSRCFDLAIFTASQQIYADSILEAIDPENVLFPYRYYRDSCTFTESYYYKDLSLICDLSNVCLIDNTPQIFCANPSNGIPIVSWYDDPEDVELLRLIPFLRELCNYDDVRPVIDANAEKLFSPLKQRELLESEEESYNEVDEDDEDQTPQGAYCRDTTGFACQAERKN